jgi:hypothetical protein
VGRHGGQLQRFAADAHHSAPAVHHYVGFAVFEDAAVVLHVQLAPADDLYPRQPGDDVSGQVKEIGGFFHNMIALHAITPPCPIHTYVPGPINLSSAA